MISCSNLTLSLAPPFFQIHCLLPIVKRRQFILFPYRRWTAIDLIALFPEQLEMFVNILMLSLDTHPMNIKGFIITNAIQYYNPPPPQTDHANLTQSGSGCCITTGFFVLIDKPNYCKNFWGEETHSKYFLSFLHRSIHKTLYPEQLEMFVNMPLCQLIQQWLEIHYHERVRQGRR